MAVKVTVCCGLDDSGSQLDDVGGCELVVVVEVADVLDDPGGLGGEDVGGEGGDPGSAGVVDRVGHVSVEGVFDCLFSACLAQLSAERDEFVMERFAFVW